MRPEIFSAPVDQLIDRLVLDFEREARTAIADRGSFTVALPGGSAAHTFFPGLARLSIDRTRVDFFWVDERAVPADSADANYRLARTLWLDHAQVPVERVHRMPAEHSSPVQAAAGYARVLAALTATAGRLDYVLLGVGPDGHVASLFPGHPLLGEQERTVAFLDDAPKPPPRRLTLTLPVLTQAGRVAIAALGAAKAAVISQALGDPQSELPVARVLQRAQRVLLLLESTE